MSYGGFIPDGFHLKVALSSEIFILIPGIPLPWKAPYVGTHGAFSIRTKPGEIIKDMIKAQYDGPILEDSIICQLTFYMPIPKSASKKNRLKMLCGIIRPHPGGDRTNLSKWYEDLCQGIIYKNDSQIVGGEPSKYYSDEPRTEIKIWTL